jgi:hypothetical protein
VREGGDPRRFGCVRAQIELFADSIQCRGDALGQRFRCRQGRDLRMQTCKLPALHLQPQPQRVPPADVGATVGVVAHPARQDHRSRVELGPAIRPGAACHCQQRGIEQVDGIATMRDGRRGLVKLVGQRDRWRAMRSHRRGRPATGRLRQRPRHRDGECERRMRGEHRGKARPLHQGAVLGPAHRTVVRIWPHQALRQFPQRCDMRRRIGAADILGDASCAAGERAVAQVSDQRADRRIVQRTGLDAPVDRKRDQQDRVAERVFLGAGRNPRGQLQEFLGKRPCPIEGSVRHPGILRRIVRCSKQSVAQANAGMRDAPTFPSRRVGRKGRCGTRNDRSGDTHQGQSPTPCPTASAVTRRPRAAR